MSEFVSCVVATRNRPHFVRQALRCFLRQTYDNSELIIVDDGEASVADLCAGVLRVRHLRLNETTPLGTKLNLGIAAARGAIIQKWDDDDYYHPQFVERAAHALVNQPTRALVVWDSFLILLAGEKYVRYSGRGWAAGGTLCFRRESVASSPFRDTPSQVDTWFIQDHQPTLVRVREFESYILVRHGCNTWNTLSGGASVDAYFKRLPIYRKPLAELVEPLDLPFYFSLERAPI